MDWLMLVSLQDAWGNRMLPEAAQGVGFAHLLPPPPPLVAPPLDTGHSLLVLRVPSWP